MPREIIDRSGEMEVFLLAVEGGSFSAAARVLGLTPSAVSRIVGRIEARLGVRLLIRTTRVLTLTAEGQAYLQAARRIVADLNDAEQAPTGDDYNQLYVLANCGLIEVQKALGDTTDFGD